MAGSRVLEDTHGSFSTFGQFHSKYISFVIYLMSIKGDVNDYLC